ncbi:T9SS C-terminal target domain-containing protein [Candidatus Marinimicrobia bacterium PRS2]|nr:T9SS C-terminal target domain-containing protein [Candidatus Marinimicrobia bacterium PRS2]
MRIILSILLLSVVVAQTDVSGMISSNTTWVVSNSPYIVTGNILVNSDVTLTIEAGVTVKFDANKTILVQGELNAQGTVNNQILFTSNQSSPSPGDWYGLSFSASLTPASFVNGEYASGSIIEYCTIEYGKELYTYGGSPFFNHSTIQYMSERAIGGECDNNPDNDLVITNCNFYYNNNNVISSCNESSLNRIIRGNNFSFNGDPEEWDSYGNLLYISNAEISNNIFSNNTLGDHDGYIIYGSSNRIYNNKIINNENATIELNNSSIFYNIFYNNDIGGYGLISYDDGIETSDSVYYNLFVNNSGGNVFNLDDINGGYIKNNIIAGNESSTIISLRYGGDNNFNFSHNSIINNVGRAIYLLYPNGIVNVKNNLLSNNTSEYPLIEIYVHTGFDYSKFDFTYNNLINNNASTYYYPHTWDPIDFSIENVYWGTTTESEIQNLILDWWDDPTLGFIDYDPWLTEPNTDAPISPPANSNKYILGDVEVSWDANPESDVAGYKVYYGNFTGYSFSNVIDVGNVNTYNLAGLVSQLDSIIAITAYDSDADGNDDQLDGYESWFAFPTVETGCTDENACNYYAGAINDDGSCTYAEENYDCDGNCIEDLGCGCGEAGPSGCDNACGSTLEVDCVGDCGGDGADADDDSVCDEIDDCVSTGAEHLVYDVDGNEVDPFLGGYDECSVCNGDGIADGACDCAGNVEDCAGDCGGSSWDCLELNMELEIFPVNLFSLSEWLAGENKIAELKIYNPGVYSIYYYLYYYGYIDCNKVVDGNTKFYTIEPGDSLMLSNTNFDPYSIKEHYQDFNFMFSLESIGYLINGNYIVGVHAFGYSSESYGRSQNYFEGGTLLGSIVINQNLNFDDSESLIYDCFGNCIVEIDCASECGGSAVVDECGVCGGSGIDLCGGCGGNGWDMCDDDDNGITNKEQYGYGAYGLTVIDIPDDQGGYVYLSFTKSFYDTDSLTTDVPENWEDSGIEGYFVERLDNGIWTNITSSSAYGADSYQAEARTLSDSTSTSNALMEYRVIAAMMEGNFVSIETETGYSVDNIAPATPSSFLGEYDINENKAVLSWDSSDANDLSHYNIYKNTDFYSIATDASFIDDITEDTEYTISAVDIHENESGITESIQVSIPYGCTEPAACNFNPDATVNDNSCLENDCFGECGGTAELDTCDNCEGDCEDDGTGFVTCSTSVNNIVIADACGECGGDGADADDDSVCDEIDDCVSTGAEHLVYDVDGNEVDPFLGGYDECSVCNGDGIADGACDCAGNTPIDLYGSDNYDCNGNQLSLFNGLIPEDFNLHSIYPNPFNPVTNIIYGLPEHANVQIVVYDMGGTQVTSLVNTFQIAGYHTIYWNASSYPSGVYLIKMDSGEFTQTQKVVLVK